MIDQLDGKSDLMHNVEDGLQNTIQTLKEQIEILEAKLQQSQKQNQELIEHIQSRETQNNEIH